MTLQSFAAPCISAGISPANDYRAEEAKQKADLQLRTLRADMRASFADIARQFDDALQEQSDALLPSSTTTLSRKPPPCPARSWLA